MIKHQTQQVEDLSFILIGYTLLTKIGEGGYGIVYKARQDSTGQLVAIKVLKTEQAESPQKREQLRARFNRETDICAQISHPNIVQLIDRNPIESERAYAVFEYVEGQTLKQYIAEHEGLSPTETSELMGQVMDALACAHQNGIVHRDLKPHNIMVSKAGAKVHAKVLDFGIGTFIQEFKTAEFQTLTLSKEFVGTPNYSAPEQLRGEAPTEKSDIYAWGLIFIECLTTRPVIQGHSIAEVFQQQLMHSSVPIPPAILSHPIGDLLRRVLNKNPQQRIASAELVLVELDRINIQSLTGRIRPSASAIEDSEEVTGVNEFVVSDASSARKQITVLCFKIHLIAGEENNLDLETLDTLSKDQLSLCKDVAIRYGGYIAGELSNTIMVYYGYPEIYDTDARRAGRTALELLAETRKRSNLLKEAHDIQLELRVAIHTGRVLVLPNRVPEGSVPDTAFELLNQTFANTALVSKDSQKLLAPFLDFELGNSIELPTVSGAVATFSLIGERQTEALSSLRSWSANRKMIGRDEEKAQLLAAWEKSKTEGQQYLLEGQAGIGKSRLVHAIKQHVQQQNAIFRECRCLPEHENNALYPILSMLKKHWGIEGMEQDRARFTRLREVLGELDVKVDEVIPILCSWLSITLSEEMEIVPKSPEEQKKLLFDTLKQSIEWIDPTGRFLLVIEDVHWIDPTSKEFLSFLRAAISSKHYFLLTTTRPRKEGEQAYDDMPCISLQALADSAVEEMASSVLNDKVLDQQASEYIAKRTDGIPLFVEELTAMLVEQDYLIEDGDTYKLVVNIEEQAVPSTLQDLLNARLDRLGLAKETAEIAATIGREFSYQLLVKASIKEESMVQADLEQLMQSDLIFHQRRVEDDRYIFRHALIGDAAYEEMTGVRRKEVHYRIASSLENEFPEQVEDNPFDVGRHWAGAEDYKNAAEYGIKDIQRSVGNSSNIEAIGTHEKTVKWAQKIADDSGQSIETELRLNDLILPAHMAKDGYGSDAVQQINQRSEVLLNEINTKGFNISNETISATSHKIEHGLFLGYLFHSKRKKALETAVKILNRLGLSPEFYEGEPPTKAQLEELIKSPHRETIIGVLPLIVQAFHANGLLNEAIHLCLIIIEIYRPETDIEIGVQYNMDPKSAALFFISALYLYKGKPDTAILKAQEAVEWSRQIEHPASCALSYTFYALAWHYLGDKAQTKKVIEEHQRFNKDNPAEDWAMLHIRFIEDWTKEETLTASSFRDSIIDSKQHYGLAWYEPSLAATYLIKGDVEKARVLLESSLDRLHTHDEIWATHMVATMLAKCYFKVDKYVSPRVISQLNEAKKIALDMGANWFELEAHVTYIDLLDQMNQAVPLKEMQTLERLKNLIIEGEDTNLVQKANTLLIKLK